MAEQQSTNFESLLYQARSAASARPCNINPCDEEYPALPSRWCNRCLIANVLALYDADVANLRENLKQYDDTIQEMAQQIEALKTDICSALSDEMLERVGAAYSEPLRLNRNRYKNMRDLLVTALSPHTAQGQGSGVLSTPAVERKRGEQVSETRSEKRDDKAWGDRRILAEKVEAFRKCAADLEALTAFPPYLPENEREMWLRDAACKVVLVLSSHETGKPLSEVV